MSKKGLVFGIQHFSIHDGEGIRSNVFLKGCPLRCLWCHNPEGLKPEIGIQYVKNKCRKCGKCGFVFQDMKKLYNLPVEKKEFFADLCPYGALETVGRWMTADQVVDEVIQDMQFFKRSTGGITLSGGEPMMQVDFALELLKKSKAEGLNTAMETSGFAPSEQYLKVLPYVDEFLWDYKETDPKKHQEFTGVRNEQILKNLDLLYEKGAGLVLRCPIIPGLTDTKEHFRGIAEKSRRMRHLKGVEIMPYHKFGVAKDQRIGRMQQKEYKVPSAGMREMWEETIETMDGRIF